MHNYILFVIFGWNNLWHTHIHTLINFLRKLLFQSRAIWYRAFVRCSIVNPPARIGNEVNKKWQRGKGGKESKSEGGRKGNTGEREGEGAKRMCAGVDVMEEELQERGRRETFVGLLVVGRRTLQIPVNRIQLRCYREYRWRLFPSVHPIHNAWPYSVVAPAPQPRAVRFCVCISH